MKLGNILFCAALISFVTGCSISGDIQEQVIGTPFNLVPPTLVESLQLIEETTVSTRTETIQPPTSTAIITGTKQLPTPTTILSEDAYRRLIEYLGDRGKCDLPCVWGIIPGVTSIEDLQNNIFIFGSVEQWSDRFDSTGYYLSIPVDTNISEYGYIGFQVYLIDDTVIEVIAPFGYLYSDKEPLWGDTIEGLGAPDEIWLSGASGPSPEEPVDFQLGLYYGELGILLEFYGTTPKIERNGIRICPSSTEFSKTTISVQTWASDEDRIPINGEDDLEMDSHRLSEYETDMTVSLFYDHYILSQEPSCFEVYPPDG